jgi:hypothetical protein
VVVNRLARPVVADRLASASGRDAAGGSAVPEQDRLRLDRLRLGRQLASWSIVSRVLPVETPTHQWLGRAGS